MGINEGVTDRIIRVTLGLIFLSLTVFGPASAWGWVGLIPLTTGLVGYCPIYKLVGLNSCSQ